MKKFQTPEIEVMNLMIADVITASGEPEQGGNQGGGTTGPEDEF